MIPLVRNFEKAERRGLKAGRWSPGLRSEGTAGPQGTGGDWWVMKHSIQRECSGSYTLRAFIKTDLHFRNE